MWFQKSFVWAVLSRKQLRNEKFLSEMEKVIPWNAFIDEILPHYTKAATWRPRMELIMMLKIYFLQQWFGLSDPAMEDAIYDRISFQKFLDIDIMWDKIPDETTILKFRHLLEKNRLQEKFFKIVTRLLEDKWLIVKEWTAVDATIIQAPSSTKNKDKKRDKDMSSTKKWNKRYFGMKAHIGVDSKNGTVHTIETTTASVHDREKYDELLHWEEKAVFWDKWYYSEEEKRKARGKWLFFGILDRAKRWSKLSNKQQKRNKKLASIRAKVEHPFQILKCQWNYTKTRYKWLLKNGLQLSALFALTNLYMMRKKLIAII